MVFAWSAAGGKVQASAHVTLIERSIDAARGSFNDADDRAFDEVKNATCESIRAALERAKASGEPVAVLHLLCHGSEKDGSFGLVLNDLDDPSAQDVVSPSRLQLLLQDYAGLVRLVVISACDGGNAGEVGQHLGSVAEEVHKAGFGAVIASRFPLSWDGARVFAAALSEGILGGLSSLEDAFLEARARLSRRASYDWASLLLYAREADGDATFVFNARPYRGLAAYGPEHARFFFGRDREIAELVADLDGLVARGLARFIVVSGASGTGKSSMVLGGAIPQWKKASADGGFAHLVVRPGAAPAAALAQIRERVAIVGDVCRRLLVVVDQFEEVFTHQDAAGAATLARALWAMAAEPDSPVCVLVTMRVDFLARCNELIVDDAGLRFDKVACDPDHQVLAGRPRRPRRAAARGARPRGRPRGVAQAYGGPRPPGRRGGAGHATSARGRRAPGALRGGARAAATGAALTSEARSRASELRTRAETPDQELADLADALMLRAEVASKMDAPPPEVDGVVVMTAAAAITRPRLEGEPEMWVEVVFSPDGTRFAAAHGAEVSLWDTAEGRLVATLRGRDQGAVNNGSLRFTHDGERLVAAFQNGTARSWGAHDGTPEVALGEGPNFGEGDGVTDTEQHSVLSSDGALVQQGRVVRLTRDGRRVATLPEGTPDSLDLHLLTGGERFLFIARDGALRTWDARRGAFEATVGALTTRLHELVAAAISPDGALVLTRERNGPLRAWSVRAGAFVEAPGVPADGTGAGLPQFSPDGRFFFAVREPDERRDLGSGVFERRYPTGSTTSFRPTSDPTRAFELPGTLRAVSHDGALAVSIGNAGSNVYFRVLEGGAQFDLRPTALIEDAARSARGLTLLARPAQRSLHLWHDGDGALVWTAGDRRTSIAAARFTADGGDVFTTGPGAAAVWRAGEARARATLRSERGDIVLAALSPEASRALVLHGDRIARLWRMADGALLHTLGRWVPDSLSGVEGAAPTAAARAMGASTSRASRSSARAPAVIARESTSVAAASRAAVCAGPKGSLASARSVPRRVRGRSTRRSAASVRVRTAPSSSPGAARWRARHRCQRWKRRRER